MLCKVPKERGLPYIYQRSMVNRYFLLLLLYILKTIAMVPTIMMAVIMVPRIVADDNIAGLFGGGVVWGSGVSSLKQ